MEGFSEFETNVFDDILIWSDLKKIGILDLTATDFHDPAWPHVLTWPQAVDFYWKEYFSG